MRRTQWAVFTSMNPRPSAWRALYEPTPATGDERTTVGDSGEDRDAAADPAAPGREPLRLV